MSRHREGFHEEAAGIYRGLLQHDPNNPDVLDLLGVANFASGRFEESVSLIQRAIALSPNVPRYYNNLGTALIDLQRFDEAIVVLQKAIELQPDLAPAYYNLGNSYSRKRMWKYAVAAYEKSLQLSPGNPSAILNLGTAYAADNRLDAAADIYRHAIENGPCTPAIASNLGNVLRDRSELDTAIEAYQLSLKLQPNDPVAHANLGNAYKDQGNNLAAIAQFRKAVELKPDFPEAHSNLVFTLYFEPSSTPEIIAAEQREWDRRHGQPLKPATLNFPNDRSPDRRLRIGYVSPDLRDHVVGRTLLPVFEAHDHEHFEFTCYSMAAPDHITERYRACADRWVETNQVTDAQLAERIRADGIDVLIDLSLHTAHNRLLTFSRRPAPVQVSWLGYPGSAGLEAIQYHLTDRFLEDRHEPGAYALPDAWCCHVHLPDSPPVNEPPSTRTGRITFGSLNNFCKMNTQVWDLWVRILQQVENSRLVLLTKAGGHEAMTRDLLSSRGIAPERIEFLRYIPATEERPQHEYLRRYHDIDIALDPFPYNGMTTTMDSLWMGVPVIALIGSTAMSRASYSLLANTGFPEFAAPTGDDYVRIAVDLAKNPQRLAEVRAALRPKMEASPLLDPRRLARNVEAAYREMWHRWVKS